MGLRLSYSGVDETVSATELAAGLANPQTFCGVLLKPRNLAGEARPRYPALAWICEALLPELQPEQAALHLCGDLAEEAVRDAEALVARLPKGFLGRFFALQINVSTYPEPAGAARALARLGAEGPRRLIVQVHDDAGRAFAERLRDAGVPGLSALLDPSRGTGLCPDRRPAPIAGVPCGYAGGITVDTAAAETLKVMGALDAAGVPLSSSWIDLETGLRTIRDDGTDAFDLRKAARVRGRVLAAAVLGRLGVS